MVNWDNSQFCSCGYRRGRTPSQTKQYTSTSLCQLTIKEIIIKHHQRNMFFFPKNSLLSRSLQLWEIYILFYFPSTKCQSLQIFSIPAQKRCLWLHIILKWLISIGVTKKMQNNSCNNHLDCFLCIQSFIFCYMQRLPAGYFLVWSRNGWCRISGGSLYMCVSEERGRSFMKVSCIPIRTTI